MHLRQALRRQYRWLQQRRGSLRDLLGRVLSRRHGAVGNSRRDAERARFWAAVREGQHEAERLCAASKAMDRTKREGWRLNDPSTAPDNEHPGKGIIT